MRNFRSSNPFMQQNVFSRMRSTYAGEVMTANGTVNKAAFLILIVFGSAIFGWGMAISGGMAITTIAALVGFGLAIFTMFKPTIANITAPVYSIAQGLFLGGISYIFESMYPGIASQAVIGTVSVFFLMMFFYRTGIIKVTERMRSIVIALTFGVALAYLISFVISLFTGYSLIHNAGTFGILFSVFVIGLAAFNLLLDFDTIENAERSGIDKKMEWFFAFSMLVTLIWLYIEILRLLSILRSSNN